MTRGFVYLGGQLLSVQQNNQVSWVHQDPVAKSKRVTNSAGTVVSTIELDPWGGDTNRNSNEAFQPRRFTSYDRDGNASDEAMHRRYNRWHSRFDQPDPYGGSYDTKNPQSFNRYSYVQNDPVNFVDPSGLLPMMCGLYMQYINGDPIGEGYICFGPSHPFFGLGEPKVGGGESEPPNPDQNPQVQKPCVFNINISGVTGQQLTDMQNEIARIFASANLSVVFNNHGQATAGSMNLLVTGQFVGTIASRLGDTVNRVSRLGATIVGSGEAQVNSTNIFLTTNRGVVRPGSFASYGTIYGRVGAHEVITHGFLNSAAHPFFPKDIRTASTAEELVSRYTARFNIGEETANALRALCP